MSSSRISRGASATTTLSTKSISTTTDDDGALASRTPATSSHHAVATNRRKFQTQQAKVVTSASPPWHSVAIVALLGLLSIHHLPQNMTHAEDTFTKRLFPHLLSTGQLAMIRILFAVIIWSTTLQGMIFSEGNYVTIPYLPGSRLRKVPFLVKGYKSLVPFTSVAWNLLGAAFTLSGWIAWNGNNEESATFVRQLALVLWQIAAPYTLLVAFVVRYVLWPMVLKEELARSGRANSHILLNPRALLQHNVNVWFAATELALLGGVPVMWSFASFTILTGAVYIVCSWIMAPYWVNDVQQDGIQFFYFFFDTTLPGYFHTSVLCGLLVVLLIFYGLFVLASSALEKTNGFLQHLVFVGIVCAATNRWRN